ncbi:MAG TPA: hypothetical protein EYP69_01485 [Bacteroidales bacterium]|nr:hypothetical protein [Bacteroidales bacterium]
MLKDIIAITGKSGLYKIIAQSGKGIVVESLDNDKKRMMVDQHYQIISLSDIAIFTNAEEKPLKDVFQNIYKIENGNETSITHKSASKDLKNYFHNVLPNYDNEKVYVSDIQKIIKWYNILNKNKILKFDETSSSKKKEHITDDVEKK